MRGVEMAADDRRVTRRRVIGLSAVTGGVVAFLASFLTWISTSTDDGGSTAITGWGGISGSSQIAGTNLNDVLGGASTYRPGIIGLIFGAVAVIGGLAVVAVSQGQRPHRVTAVVLLVAGGVLLAWGSYRGIAPGDAGVLDAGEGSAGAGPWVTALGGGIVVGAAGLILAGRIDPAGPPATRRRGIQPR